MRAILALRPWIPAAAPRASKPKVSLQAATKLCISFKHTCNPFRYTCAICVNLELNPWRPPSAPCASKIKLLLSHVPNEIIYTNMFNAYIVPMLVLTGDKCGILMARYWCCTFFPPAFHVAETNAMDNRLTSCPLNGSQRLTFLQLLLIEINWFQYATYMYNGCNSEALPLEACLCPMRAQNKKSTAKIIQTVYIYEICVYNVHVEWA